MKHKLEIEYSTGKVEKLTASAPICRIIVDRVIQKRWPWKKVKVDGHEIIGKPDKTILNKYLTKDGIEIIL